MTTDLTWLIGGPQGSGVESGANIFSKVCAGIGYQIFGKREFYSNIKGEHSYFAVRISDKNIKDKDGLICFPYDNIDKQVIMAGTKLKTMKNLLFVLNVEML